jgi:membrane protein YdbS with pleckstrin-like domain
MVEARRLSMSENLTSVAGTVPEQSRAGLRSPQEVIIGAPASATGAEEEHQTQPSDKSELPVLCVGYDAKHLLPGFVLGVALTLAAIAASVKVRAFLPAWLAPLVTSLLWAGLAGLWTFLLFRWAYRVLFWRVEVTEREVVYRRGWLWPKCSVPLTGLARVEVRQSWWQRLLGFGHLALIPESPGAEATVLLALTEPHTWAELLTKRIQQAREAGVHESHLRIGVAQGMASLIT